jgi:hypothetical protein
LPWEARDVTDEVALAVDTGRRVSVGRHARFMTDHAQSLLREALSLSEEERAGLIAELLISLEGPAECDAAARSRRGRPSLSDGHDGSWPAKRRGKNGARSVTVSAER